MCIHCRTVGCHCLRAGQYTGSVYRRDYRRNQPTIIVQNLQANTSAVSGRSRRPVGGLPNFALPAESPTLAAFSRRAFSGGVPMGVGEARSSSPTSRLADRQPVSPTASGSVRCRLMHAPKSNTASAPPSTAQVGGFRASTAVTTHRRHPLN